MANTSKCVFCRSTAYGKGCPFSSFKNKIHLHSDDGTRCSFCGSHTTIGPGCPYSPTGKHMAGANFFNSMAQESFILAYIMRKLVEPIYESQAYKLGILDLDGNVIKKPETIEEHMAYSNIDAYLFRLRTLIGPKIELLNNSQLLESISKSSRTPIEHYKEEVETKAELERIAKQFTAVLSESKLPLAVMQKLILDTFTKTC